MRLEYLPALRTMLTTPLVREPETGGIQKAIELMQVWTLVSARSYSCSPVHVCLHTPQSYCVSREMFDYILDVTKFKTKAAWGGDPMRDVPTKVKSAFTR